jgi:hypothetical protein
VDPVEPDSDPEHRTARFRIIRNHVCRAGSRSASADPDPVDKFEYGLGVQY